MSDKERAEVLEKVSSGIERLDAMLAAAFTGAPMPLSPAAPAPANPRSPADAILVTPTVVKVSRAPELQIIRNLSEADEVLRALGLPQKESA